MTPINVKRGQIKEKVTKDVFLVRENSDSSDFCHRIEKASTQQRPPTHFTSNAYPFIVASTSQSSLSNGRVKVLNKFVANSFL